MLSLFALIGWLIAAAGHGPTVDVALVIAVDVSESMDRGELAVQRAGYVAALRHADFARAVEAGGTGRIAISYFEWAASVRQGSVVPWTIVDSATSAAAFADRVAAQPFRSFRGTSISEALAFGKKLQAESGISAERRVIDISGDGPNNYGAPVTGARDAVVADGVVVNGLPILIRPSPTFPAVDLYYAACVIGGPGAFVLPVHDVAEFATAIRRKLVLEVSGIARAPAILPAAADPAVDCLVGERLRRALSDKFYPQLDR